MGETDKLSPTNHSGPVHNCRCTAGMASSRPLVEGMRVSRWCSIILCISALACGAASSVFAGDNLFIGTGTDAGKMPDADSALLGWHIRSLDANPETTISSDVKQSQVSGKPFVHLAIKVPPKAENGFLELISHQIKLAGPGDYSFTMEYVSGLAGGLDFAVTGSPSDPKTPVIISEIPVGVNLYPAQDAASITAQRFPPGQLNKVELDITVPPGVEYLTFSMNLFRRTDDPGDGVSFGGFKLEKENN